ncbi:hypothetical protein AAH978_07760 [Streptomyces sp. ZYX-F-203]
MLCARSRDHGVHGIGADIGTAFIGATWISSGVVGTVELLRRGLVPGGMVCT